VGVAVVGLLVVGFFVGFFVGALVGAYVGFDIVASVGYLVGAVVVPGCLCPNAAPRVTDNHTAQIKTKNAASFRAGVQKDVGSGLAGLADISATIVRYNLILLKEN
jgi:hypothetical protein